MASRERYVHITITITMAPAHHGICSPANVMNFPELFSLVAWSICATTPFTPCSMGSGAALIPALWAAWLPSCWIFEKMRKEKGEGQERWTLKSRNRYDPFPHVRVKELYIPTSV